MDASFGQGPWSDHGTFLRGLIHLGEKNGQRAGWRGAAAIGSRPRSNAGLYPRQIEDGHATRLDGTTIDWSAVEMQPATIHRTVFGDD